MNAREKAEKLAADHALVQDVLRLLPEAVEEEKVVKAIRDLFAMLMAPKGTAYIPVTNSRLQLERANQLRPGDIQIIKKIREFAKDLQFVIITAYSDYDWDQINTEFDSPYQEGWQPIWIG